MPIRPSEDKSSFRYAPMLAIDAASPPIGEEFSFECKWDGYRAGLLLRDGALSFISRRGTNMADWFPELGTVVDLLGFRTGLIDGEIIAGNGSILSFNDLQRRARRRGRGGNQDIAISFVAFDLLCADGIDYTTRPLNERRERLAAVVQTSDRLALSRSFDDGLALFSAAAANGLEGIVAKRTSSVYEPGRRSRSWLKVKVPGAWRGHDWDPTRK